MPRQPDKNRKDFNKFGKRKATVKKATDKYLAKFDRLTIRIPEGGKSELMAYAESLGLSLNQFVLTAIEEKISRLK